MVGMRVRAGITDRFKMTLAGNVGGFGVGSASEFSWSAIALLGYSWGEHWTSSAGYRALGFDKEGALGAADLTMRGPIVGLSYRF